MKLSTRILNICLFWSCDSEGGFLFSFVLHSAYHPVLYFSYLRLVLTKFIARMMRFIVERMCVLISIIPIIVNAVPSPKFKTQNIDDIEHTQAILM